MSILTSEMYSHYYYGGIQHNSLPDQICQKTNSLIQELSRNVAELHKEVQDMAASLHSVSKRDELKGLCTITSNTSRTQRCGQQ